MSDHIRNCRHELSIIRFRIEERLAKGCPRPWTPQLTATIKNKFQEEVTKQLADWSQYDGETRLITE